MKQSGKKILVLSIGMAALLFTACGKKDEKAEETQSAPAPAAAPAAAAPVAPPPPPPALPAKFEDASQGTPLEKATEYPKASFELMAKNLGGTKWAKVNFESTYDYIIKNLYSETPSFAKGPNEHLAGGTYQTPTYHMAFGGYGDGVYIQTSGNYADPGNVYSFQYRIDIGGLILYSTESVALFHGGNGEILKVNYTSTTPVIQRFRINQLYNSGTDTKWIIFQQNYDTAVEFAPQSN